MTKTFIYLRISTDKQDINTHIQSCVDYCKYHQLENITMVKEEAVSGTVPWRKRKLFTEIVVHCEKGDAIVLPELSRAGRSTLDVRNFLAYADEHKIHIHVVKGDLRLRGQDDPMTDIMISVYNAMAKMERDLISERTKAGMARRKMEVEAAGGQWMKKTGVYKQRELSISRETQDEIIDLYTIQKIPIMEIVRKLNVTYTIVTSCLKRHNIPITKEQTMSKKALAAADEIIKYIHDNISSQQIADKLNVSLSTINNTLHKLRKMGKL
jgi:DNA invertase Pin-like site-specific DNA recombinase